jgi:predicted O-methyltransferase YrrM
VEIVNSEEEVQITDKLIKPKYGALLMRITNYFKPQTLLQIGSDGGFTSLYLAAFNSAICCVVLEEKPEIAAFARFVIEKQGYKNILLQEGSYKKTIPLFLANTNKLDFVYFSEQNDVFLNSSVFDRILPYLHEESFLVIRGIRKTKEKKEFWNRLCARAEVRVTIDVYELGIVFFNPKIHKRNYIVSF